MNLVEQTPKFYCSICLEDEGTTSYQLSCGHQFCRDCLTAYFQAELNSVPIRCPQRDCAQEIQMTDLENYLPPDRIQRFKMLKEKRACNNKAECPFCASLNEGDPQRPVITCAKCDQQYCLVHANAHPVQVTCEEYEVQYRNDKDVLLSLDMIQSNSKKCPGCFKPTEKDPNSCNRVICSQCQTAWCYNCGQSKWGADLNWPKCQVCGEQFIDHAYAMRQMCIILALLIIFMPIWLPVCVVIMLLVFLFYFATCCCCRCFRSPYQPDEDELQNFINDQTIAETLGENSGDTLDSSGSKGPLDLDDSLSGATIIAMTESYSEIAQREDEHPLNQVIVEV